MSPDPTKNNEPCEPGDEDLSIDVDGLDLASVVVLGREVLITLSDGFGWWIQPDGELVTYAPGADNERVENVTVVMDLEHWDDKTFDYLLMRLERWRREGAILRFLGGHGRVCTLMKDNSDWVPLARTH